jgi:hypothetical protein
MHYVLFIFAFLLFAFIAPAETVFSLCLSLLLVTSVVKFTASAVTGDREISLAQSFKSVALACFFLAIALFTLRSFSRGTGISDFTGVSALPVLGGFLFSYILGFRFGLGTSFGASAIIAVFSTIVSAALYFLFRTMLA